MILLIVHTMDCRLCNWLHNLSAALALSNTPCVCTQTVTLSPTKGMWGCSALKASQRAEWRSTTMADGEQCVTTAGTSLRLRWCVVSSTSLEREALLGRTMDQVRSFIPHQRAVNHCTEWGAVIKCFTLLLRHFTATGPIWLDDISCKGTENYLVACGFKDWGITDCTHKEDVGVICETGSMYLNLCLIAALHALFL